MPDLSKYQAEDAPPKAGAMINTFRSFGYNLRTAIADIIDNSISAGSKNIRVNYTWLGAESTVSILDDGSGMNLTELIDAMTAGSKNPEDERDKYDLGRFGLGLKTASFSQCKILTVATKQSESEIIKRCWNLDFVNSSQNWTLLNYISDETHLDDLQKLPCGTLVLWEAMDRLVGNSLESNEAVRKVFLQDFELVEKHLSMVFHRYLENKKIKIFINNLEIKAWNPFLKGEKGRQLVAEEKVANERVKIKCYVMPHASMLSEEGRKEGGGTEGWYAQQGFYIYRNERLLVAGDWLGLFPKNEHYKLARILVDIPNSMDSDWKIDIKKSTAIPPLYLLEDLYKKGLTTRMVAADVHRFRAEQIIRNSETSSQNFEFIWSISTSRDGTKNYKINKNHSLIQKLIAADNVSKKEFSQFLKIIEESLPIELIIQNHSDNPEVHELREKVGELDTNTIEIAKKMYASLKASGVSHEIAIKQIFNIEPFNHYKELIEYFN